MKKYFAKFLPIKGKIKEHTYAILDLGFNNSSIVRVMSTKKHYSNVSADGNSWDTMTGRLTPVKLFLCSRDITFGRGIYSLNELQTEFGSMSKDKTSGRINLFLASDPDMKYVASPLESQCIKVIGEISSNAVWVKDGNEFDREELFVQGHGVNWSTANTGLKFKVKCPTCNTFH
jgi:hypothetical protein